MVKNWLQDHMNGLSPRGAVIWVKGIIKQESGLVYTTFGNMGSSILGALFWLVFASILSVENYGLVNYFIALASIFSALGLMGLDATIITFLAKGEREVHNVAISLTLVSGLVIALSLSVYQWVSGILAVAMIFFAMTLAEMLGRKMYRGYAFTSIGQRVVQIFLSAVLYFEIGIFGIVLGYFLGNFVFSYRYLRSVPKFSLNLDGLRGKRNFALHSYGFNLIRNFTNYLDKIVIGPVFGYYVLGLYQLGFQFLLLLSIIPLSLYSYLLPEESSGKNKRGIKIFGVLIAIVAAVAAYAVTPFVIQRLFPTFIESISVVRIMSLAVVPSTVAAILNASFLARGRSKIVFVAGAIYFITLAVGMGVLGQAMGALGLAISLVSAQSTQAAFLIFRTRRNILSKTKRVEPEQTFAV